MAERGHVSLDTIRFETLPEGGTRISTVSIFQSVADHDQMVESGMERGVRESNERLAELYHFSFVFRLFFVPPGRTEKTARSG